jgi:dihydrofolate synthase/folylpolyglutamate synthase
MPLPASTTAYDEALAFLFSRIDYERAPPVPYGARDFKLDRMHDLLHRLGNPHRRLRIVHVAGTKGKGSTAAMLASVLTAAGYRTGLFSSPHLHQVEERIRIDGEPCYAARLAELVARVQPLAQEMDCEALAASPPDRGPTYFELTTAMALVHFNDQKVDAAVLEVGLGGRLDSTNVCQPAVAVITSISFDHMRQLGNTLSAIAWEKAGIVKPGVPTVSGVVEEEPRRAIAEVCAERGSPLCELGRDFSFEYHAPRGLEHCAAKAQLDFHYRLPGRELELRGLELGLVGRHQAANASVALATLLELRRQGWNIPEPALRAGLSELNWPARVEVIARRPAVVLDAAHNVASAAALLATLEESFAARRRMLVFATTRDKDARGMLALLLPHFDRVIFTRYWNNPRGIAAEELAALAADLPGGQRLLCHDTAAAWDEVHRLAAPEDLICITGSFFLAAEMRRHALERPLISQTR